MTEKSGCLVFRSVFEISLEMRLQKFGSADFSFLIFFIFLYTTMPTPAIIVVPCYNEGVRLRGDAFIDYVQAHDGISFLFVEDGSTDNTAAVLTELVRQRPEQLSMLLLPENIGKAEAVRAGVLAAIKKEPEYIGFWDADLATPLWEIDRFLSVFQQGNERALVMGARIKRLGAEIVRHRHRHYIGRGVAMLVSRTLDLAVYDTQCGAKLFRRQLAEEVFAEPFVSTWLFDVELLARIISRYGRRRTEEMVFELPLTCWRDIGGSKVNFLFACKIPFELLRISRRWLQ